MELTFGTSDRVLLLGASGWFGRTFHAMLPKGVPVLPVAGTKRGIYEVWSSTLVRDFNPTIVVNFAFLTSERVQIEGLERFVDTNETLTARLLQAAELPRVHAVMTASSGAAKALPLSMESNPYGVLKLREENALMSVASHRRNVVVARAWSVSGSHVRNPNRYAFSQFILQARRGRVRIEASRPVIRRYVAVDDFLSVCTNHLTRGWTGDIDSGGERIEVGSLAERIVSIVNPSATVTRAPWTSDAPSEYASDNITWEAACGRIGFGAANIDEQIRRAGLLHE
jgi:nucleoside-diphosphate-sugar epimerase